MPKKTIADGGIAIFSFFPLLSSSFHHRLPQFTDRGRGSGPTAGTPFPIFFVVRGGWNRRRVGHTHLRGRLSSFFLFSYYTRGQESDCQGDGRAGQGEWLFFSSSLSFSPRSRQLCSARGVK